MGLPPEMIKKIELFTNQILFWFPQFFQYSATWTSVIIFILFRFQSKLAFFLVPGFSRTWILSFKEFSQWKFFLVSRMTVTTLTAHVQLIRLLLLPVTKPKKKNLKLLAQHHQSPWELFSGPVPGSLQNNFTSTYMKLILTYQSLPLRIPKLLTYVTSFTLLGFAGNSRTNFGDIYQLSCTNPFPHTHNLFNNSIIKWEVASVKHSHFPQSKIVHLPSPLIVLSINSPANTQQTTRV